MRKSCSFFFFFFSSRRRHTRLVSDWSSDVCSSDLDSDEGRAYAAAITALMTGRAYRKSAEIASRMGSFAGYQPNAAAMLGVIAKHRAAVGNIAEADSVPEDLLTAARRSWDQALDFGEVNGFRNAQATELAPTGTISFMMDCDTTGVEP